MKNILTLGLMLIIMSAGTVTFATYKVQSPSKYAKYYDTDSIYCHGKGTKNTYASCDFGYMNDYYVEVKESSKHIYVSKKGTWYCSHSPEDTWSVFEDSYGKYKPSHYCSVHGYKGKRIISHKVSHILVCPSEEDTSGEI